VRGRKLKRDGREWDDGERVNGVTGDEQGPNSGEEETAG
jgi:hypothetical protein